MCLQLTCTSSAPSAFAQFYVVIGHLAAEDSGSQLVVSCSGLTPQYTLTYIGGGGSHFLPPEDTVSAGDKLQTIATLSILGGETSIFINDTTKGWTFGVSGAEPIDTTSSVILILAVAEPGGGTSSRPLLQFSPINTSGDKATLNGHTGRLGSFLSLTRFNVYKWILVDAANGNVLARPSSITSTSSGFKINWVQGS